MSQINIQLFISLLVVVAGMLILIGWIFNRNVNRRHFTCRAGSTKTQLHFVTLRKKPDCVIAEVLRLKVLMGKHAGCRKVAQTFNQLHGPLVTVGKTFVSDVINGHQYALVCLTRDMRAKKPVPVAVNAVWGMDMSFLTDDSGKTHAFVGIVDHGLRVCTKLAVLLNKKSWTLLGHLCLAIGKYGKPQALRTDNEACMNSFVFRTFLKLVGIKKQTIPVASLWCNGRIERFFGTLKPWLKPFVIHAACALQAMLLDAQSFYNHVRPHQNLNGMTPVEAWKGLTPVDLKQTKSATAVQALDVEVGGYYFRV
jgi:putative transposase